MIDKLIQILGELPKERRKAILRGIDLFTWVMLIIDMIVGLPAFWVIINVAICFVMLMLTVRLIQIGGWWWTNDGE